MGPTATSGQVLQSAGSSADPVFSTATYPATTTINQILYSSSANVVAGITAANNGTLISGATGIPSFLANGTTGQILTATTGSPPSWSPPAASSISITGNSGGALVGAAFTFTGGTTGLTFSGSGSTETLTGTLILANGGTSASLVASNGGIFYSTAAAGAILAGTATANKVLMSGATAAPTWSTPTFPNASATSGKFIQSDGTNWIASTPTFPTTAGTSGKILISDGTNWISSTPTYPNAASTALKHIKSDGTNFVTTTVTYPDASVTAGKVIVSDGTNYIASTPTFPNASATTRKMIVSDGTNWVASTETWAVPGTSGNVLTSDGTNWTSAAPAGGGGFTTITGTLTNAQIKALHGTPVQVIAAQGSGTVIRITTASVKMIYGGTNVFTAAASQTINLYYATSTSIATMLSNAQIVASASQITMTTVTTVANTYATYDNLAVNFYVSAATEITGNAANNNTVSYSITYQVLSI